MSNWLAPPGFNVDGSPPPVRSPLHDCAPDFRGRVRRDIGPSAVERLMSTSSWDDPELAAAHTWLTANRTSEAFAGTSTNELKALLWRSLDPAGAALWQRIRRRRELIRLQRRTFWKRTDPVAYLAPGTSQRLTVSYTAGLSTSVTSELIQTLGVSMELTAGGVLGSATHKTRTEQQTRIATSVTWTESVEISRTEELRNFNGDCARAYAIWRPGCVLDVSRLRLTQDELTWRRLGRYEYEVAGDLATTSGLLPG